MRPIVNLSEEDRATDTSNTHKKFGKDRECRSGDILMDRQTDPQTDILVTILCKFRKIGTKNFNRLSRVHERYRQTDDRRTGDSK